MCSIRVFVRLAFALGCIALVHGAAINDGFELSIIHLNDFHARFEEVNSASQTCSIRDDECFGGFSRLYAKIIELKNKQPNSIVLDAGDSYQGTLWYRMYKWEAIQYFMNKIPFDAHTIGNHEFDDKIAGLVPLLEHFKAPTVIANMEDSEEPSLHGLYEKSIVVERNGFRIGVIGVLIATTHEISDTEKVTFLDESESVNKEAERLVAEEDVDTIIVLSHCGYDIDKIIAKKAGPKIGLIVGGHSHSLLYNGIPPNNFTASGEYPTVITHGDGRKVIIVQALAFTFFLGHLHVNYNSQGDVISWSGDPIYLNETIAQDPQVNEEIVEWRSGLEEIENEVVGETHVYLDRQHCKTAECNMGNLVVDSMIYARLNVYNNHDTIIGLMNSGGIRISIRIGEITQGNLFEVLPFESKVDIAELQGKYIKEALEHSAKPFSMAGVGLLQVSGIKVVFNSTNEVGSKVQSLKIRCFDCAEPSFEDIDMEKYYTIVSNSFVMAGKDGFTMISKNIINHKSGEDDVKHLTLYVSQQSPITQTTEGRITIVS